MNLTSLGNHESCYKKCHGTSAEICMAWLYVLFLNRFSSYSIQYTCTYAQHSWQRIIISRADRERCKGFWIPMKKTYLLNSLSKIIENNKPQPVPLFRFLGNILHPRIFSIFFQIWTCLTFFRCLRFDVTIKTSYPWITEQNLKALVWRREWVVVKAKYIYVNFSMDLVPRMSIDRLNG